MKRFLDLCMALVLLLLALPAMVVVAVLIAARRDGPVLFRQQRVGRGQRPFEILKFRTMRHRAVGAIDQVRERVVAAGNDDRITPLGRKLRASSIDELPQLLNVLSGAMSMVGPRPVIPEQVRAIPETHLDRFLVLPGLTGWAQVNGRRGVDWIRQLELDSWYANNRNLTLDLKILFKTVSVVLRGSGTYGDAKSNWRSYLPLTDNQGK